MTRALPLILALAMLGTACAQTTPSADRVRSSPRPSPVSTRSAPTASPVPADPFAAARALEAPDPGTLATRLEAAERGLRTDTPEDPERLGRVQQAAYRQLARTPEWREPVISALPEDLRWAAEANLAAALDLRALTSPREGLPVHWEIVPPPPPHDLRTHYVAAGEEFGVGWEVLAAIHLVETRMGRIRGDSTAGARGPMQFLPRTWEAYGEGDIHDPGDAIRAAARYLAAHGAHEDLDGALWAYNHSNRYVRAIRRYAEVMAADPRTHIGYHQWQVYYRTTSGDALLEVGWTGSA